MGTGLECGPCHIEVLKTHPCHEKDTVDTHAPFLGQHDLGFFPELGCADILSASLFGFEELLGLWEANAKKAHANGNASYDDCKFIIFFGVRISPTGNPENGLPALYFTAHAKIGASCEDIPQ